MGSVGSGPGSGKNCHLANETSGWRERIRKVRMERPSHRYNKTEWLLWAWLALATAAYLWQFRSLMPNALDILF